MHEKEYAAYGVTREAICQFSHLPSPDSSLGPDATAWHQNALQIARSMKVVLNKMQDERTTPQPKPSLSI